MLRFLLLLASIATSSASECGSSQHCSLPDNVISFIQQSTHVRFRKQDQSVDEHGQDKDLKWLGEDALFPARGLLDRALDGAALDPLGSLGPEAELAGDPREKALVQSEIKKKIADDNAFLRVSVANNAMEKAGMAGDTLGSLAWQDRAAKRARMAWNGAGWGAYAAARAARGRALWGTRAIQKAADRNAYMNAKMASNEAWLNAFEKNKVAKTQAAEAASAARSKARAAAMIKDAAKERAWASALGHHSLALEQSKEETANSDDAANPEGELSEAQLQELSAQLKELAVRSLPAVEQSPQPAAEKVINAFAAAQEQLQQMREKGAVHNGTRVAAPRADENAAHNAAVLAAAKATAETVQSKKKHDDMILVSGNNKKIKGLDGIEMQWDEADTPNQVFVPVPGSYFIASKNWGKKTKNKKKKKKSDEWVGKFAGKK